MEPRLKVVLLLRHWQQRSCRCCRILRAKSKANLKVSSLDSNSVTARGFRVLSRSLFTCHNGGIRNRRTGGLTLQLTTLMRLLAPGDQASTAHMLLPAESTANKERRRPPTNTAPHSRTARRPAVLIGWTRVERRQADMSI